MRFTGAHMLYTLDVFILALYLLPHVCALLKYMYKHSWFQDIQILLRFKSIELLFRFQFIRNITLFQSIENVTQFSIY